MGTASVAGTHVYIGAVSLEVCKCASTYADVCMYTLMHMCECLCVFACVPVHVSMCVQMYACVDMPAYVQVHMCKCMCPMCGAL